ncbi:hypothetical protein CEUSTIGMA_g5711.t1 [Chlamydomonas eustigma]|uniref:COX assembly mitochondrial protein n=1 Tax=Chlamydomonas eustigma TaxID=1157962 RepID=A0A250X5T0_9CHLO|nr:hypothetical protein CEUSTIGMA_g5711.t1 [Chlamydomonas eustigma]|eukprot:GAX78269.1 hypothetical protein CEUSTIGMA_g5711.t1 [Chlamydomonas eustigma]
MTDSTAPEKSYKISRQASNKITYKITLIAEQKCQDLIAAYNNCAKGRGVSMIWACKGKYNESQDCVHKYLNENNVALVTRRWVDAGKPSKPDWDEILKGIAEEVTH